MGLGHIGEDAVGMMKPALFIITGAAIQRHNQNMTLFVKNFNVRIIDFSLLFEHGETVND